MNSNSRRSSESSRSNSITDIDAVYFRFRPCYPLEIVQCLTCNMKYKSWSILDIYEHYYYLKHLKNNGECLYCGGNVYKYLFKDETRVFHNCGRALRGAE